MIELLLVERTRPFAEALATALTHGRAWSVRVAVSPTDALNVTYREAVDAAVIALPAPVGCAVCRELLDVRPGAKAIALCTPGADAEVLRWAGAGVSGCVSRSASLAEVVDAVETVLRGRTYCSQQLVGAFFSARSPRSPVLSEHASTLTQREWEILDLIAQGLRNKQIASVLHLQLATVKNHTHNAFVKIGVHSRSEAARWLVSTADKA